LLGLVQGDLYPGQEPQTAHKVAGEMHLTMFPALSAVKDLMNGVATPPPEWAAFISSPYRRGNGRTDPTSHGTQ